MTSKWRGSVPVPLRHALANKPRLAVSRSILDHSGENALCVDTPDHGVEGRAQGIRDWRELKRNGGGKGN